MLDYGGSPVIAGRTVKRTMAPQAQEHYIFTMISVGVRPQVKTKVKVKRD